MVAREGSAGLPLAGLSAYIARAMASKPPPPPTRVLEPLSAPQHFVAPTAREIRAQAVQRLQTGLFGLAVIMLIVGLADIINERARKVDAAGAAPAAQASATPTGNVDPLADAGVVPSASASASGTPAPTPGAPQH